MGFSTTVFGASNAPLIKSERGNKSDKDLIKLKLRRDPTSENLDLCEFKISLFKNGKPEKVFFVHF